MFELKGKYGNAIIFADNIEETAYSQIVKLVNHPVSKGAHTRIMPDVHTGIGCVIGYTAKLTDIVIPNLIGVDIGCGVLTFCFNDMKLTEKDFLHMDKIIKENIPSGTRIRKSLSFQVSNVCEQYLNIDFSRFLKSLKNTAKRTSQDVNYALFSLGSLGSGNHFIEIEKTKNAVCFSVHSGSRKFGLNIANFHQKIAKKLTKSSSDVPSGMEFLKKPELFDYIEDMKVAQTYAKINRYTIIKTIIDLFTSQKEDYIIESVHNYINFDDKVVRKGAISAHKNEKVVIPLDMSKGLIMGEGLGNKEWNYSAPHGAGRKMSRKQAKKSLSLEEFKKRMKNVYSSCINAQTLDESPMAYKDSGYILKYLKETVKINEIARPVYNFKAS